MRMPKGTSTKVWRISESAPMGEWVELTANPRTARTSKNALPEVEQGTWVRSSYDLLDGIDVIDAEDTVPAELFDELFGVSVPPAKAARG